MNDLTGGKLIGEGSNTCVFQPNLPCKNKKIDISDKKVSKLFLKKPKDLKKEIDFNRKISHLPNSREWSVVLDDTCQAPEYDKIKSIEPDIDKCLKNNDMKTLTNFDILYGPFGGVSMDTAFDMKFIDIENTNFEGVDTFIIAYI